MAVTKPWIHLQNPFLIATIGSFKLAVRISTYHLGTLRKMAGIPFFDALISLYLPLHTSLSNAYNNWKAQGGIQEGETLNIKQLLRLQSSTKIKAWDLAIETIYADYTPQYKALLPNSRKPFQRGNQIARISASEVLADAIGTDAALQTVKTDALAFHAQLTEALLLQKGSKSGTQTSSKAVEAARVAACIGMYSNLGGLIQATAGTPQNASQYFDLTAIRNGRQVLFTGDTKPEQHENILQKKLTPADKLLLQNEGLTELRFYFTLKKKGVPGENLIILAAGTQLIITVSDAGNPQLSCLNVYNPDANATGEWTVEFIK